MGEDIGAYGGAFNANNNHSLTQKTRVRTSTNKPLKNTSNNLESEEDDIASTVKVGKIGS